MNSTASLTFAGAALLGCLHAAPAAAQGVLPPVTRAPGLYVQVVDGLVHVTNPGGAQNFTSGQFGYTPSATQAPALFPTNPGIQFTPPPSFASAAGASTRGSAAGAGGKSNAVDCEVR
jgi:hypothetical protein